jgi:hypothetical protein
MQQTRPSLEGFLGPRAEQMELGVFGFAASFGIALEHHYFSIAKGTNKKPLHDRPSADQQLLQQSFPQSCASRPLILASDKSVFRPLTNARMLFSPDEVSIVKCLLGLYLGGSDVRTGRNLDCLVLILRLACHADHFVAPRWELQWPRSVWHRIYTLPWIEFLLPRLEQSLKTSTQAPPKQAQYKSSHPSTRCRHQHIL